MHRTFLKKATFKCNDFSKLTIGLFYSVHTFHLARDSTSTPDRSESLLFRPSSSRWFSVTRFDYNGA